MCHENGTNTQEKVTHQDQEIIPTSLDENYERERRIRKAKRNARSELSVSKGHWSRHGYSERADLISATDVPASSITRLAAKDTTPQQFIEQFEKPRIPCIITGICDQWPAYKDQLWSEQSLLHLFPPPKPDHHHHHHHRFKVGEDDDGYPVKLTLTDFLHYAHTNTDDSPLYIFDASFADNKKPSKCLVYHYSIPALFQEDLLQHAGERRRPPYRWLVLGPTRSGSSIHIDPLATSAWNALIQGRKRWVLFPPDTPKHLVKPPRLEREAIVWFDKVLPKTRGREWPEKYKPIEVVQEAGETMYVPAGWWHAVLNIEDTVAVTHNFCSTTNFPEVWRRAKKGRPKMSAKWERVLEERRPDLARIAKLIDCGKYGGNEREGCYYYPSSSSSSSSEDSSSSSSSNSSSSSEKGDVEGSRYSKRHKTFKIVT